MTIELTTTDQRRRTSENAQIGIRGGVHIWAILPLFDPILEFKQCAFSRQKGEWGFDGVDRDNIIVRRGRAVTFFSLGQVVVARNRLVTQGSTGRVIMDLIAATVLIKLWTQQ